jgi:hypothetical protein
MPVLSRAPSPVHHAEPHEDPRALVRAAVGEALAPVQQAFREIQRRLDDLERRPIAVAPAPAAPAAVAPAAAATAPAQYRPPQATYPGGNMAPGSLMPAATVSMVPIPVTIASMAPRPPILDVAAIERDVNVHIDGAIDGRRRRLRLALTFTLVLVAIFGGLFAALAYSYAPHPSGSAPATGARGEATRLTRASIRPAGASFTL